jgi:alpha-L-fucosidase
LLKFLFKYQQCERIRSYIIEGLEHGIWKKLTEGISVGRKKIDYFDSVKVSRVRLRVSQASATPLIRSFSVYNVSDFKPFSNNDHESWKVCAEWNADAFRDCHCQLKVNLTAFIPEPGQYEIKIIPSQSSKQTALRIDSVTLYFQGERAHSEFLKKSNDFDYCVNQTQQVTKETSTELLFYLSSVSKEIGGGVVIVKKK